MKRKIHRKFTETIQSINISKQDIDTMSQKASERISMLRAKKAQKD